MLCTTPSARLLAHEWAKHGSCMAAQPARYFARERQLWSAIRWPDFDRLSRKRGLTAGDVRRAIAEANPRWKPGDIGIDSVHLRRRHKRRVVPAVEHRRVGDGGRQRHAQFVERQVGSGGSLVHSFGP